jgi:hypothetical protein
MNALALALLLVAPQADEKFVPKAAKDPYLSAVRELKKAVDLISEEPGTAIEKANSILANSRITKTECRLKIEIASADYIYEDFFPYQVRGRARMAQAKKVQLEAAVDILKAAIDDFKNSADKKVPGSAELQKSAEEELRRVEKAIVDAQKPEDPSVDFQRLKFGPAIRKDQYRTAVTLTTGPEGKDLSEEQRAAFIKQAEDACRDYVADRIIKIRGYFGDIRTVKDLKELGDGGFRQQFTNHVPPEAELTEKAAQEPALVWIRKHVKTLKSIQAGQLKATDVFEAAHEALATDPPEAEGENPWFKGMSLLAASMIEETITACTRDSEKCLKADRQKRQADAENAHLSWKEFIDRTDKKVVERHPDLAYRTDRLDRVVKEFPVELAQLASFDIERYYMGDPLKELKAAEEGLKDLVSSLSGMGRVAIESRQELYTKLITVGSLWRFMEGKTESDIVRDLSDHRLGLKSAGGPTHPERYGPKVKRVFDGLKM